MEIRTIDTRQRVIKVGEIVQKNSSPVGFTVPRIYTCAWNCASWEEFVVHDEIKRAQVSLRFVRTGMLPRLTMRGQGNKLNETNYEDKYWKNKCRNVS